MKNLIRRSVICLMGVAMLTASGCNGKESKYTIATTTVDMEAEVSAMLESEITTTEDLSQDPSSNRQLTKRFGSFDMAEGWTEVPEHSSAPFYFTYVLAGTEHDEYPNNITVYANASERKAEECAAFKKDILDNLNAQAASQNIQVEITDSSVISESGLDVLRFEIVKESNRTVQYYIVGDMQYVIVSASIYNEAKAKEDRIEEVAQSIVNSFVWSESGVKN